MNTESVEDSVRQAVRVLEKVRRDYPVPFSVFASEILFEVSAPNPDWSRIFLLQIDFFEASVAFFFFVLLAEVEQHEDITIKESYNHLKTLRKGKNLSTGHWWGLLRGLSNDASKIDSASLSKMGRVARSLFLPQRSTTGKRLTKLLNEIPEIRNRYKGHSFTLAPEQYAEQAKALLKKTTLFFQEIKEIDDVTILYITQCTALDNEEFIIDFLLLNGDMRRPLRRYRKAKKSIAKGSLWIGVENELEYDFDVQRFLSLTPFVQFNPANSSFSISQHIQKNKFELIHIIGGERGLAEHSDSGLRRLDALLSRVDRTNEKYQHIVIRSRELAEVLLKSPAAKASYEERTYLNRPRLIQQLSAISQENRAKGIVRIWLASAPSGSGKTALACHSMSQWLSDSRSKEVMVTALSSEVISSQGSIQEWWKQRFGMTLLESCVIVHSADAIIRIFIDGLDRIQNPKILVEEIANLMKSEEQRETLRIIISSTEAISNQAFAVLKKHRLDNIVNRWSVPPLSPEEARKLFSILHPEAKEVQLGKEVESLLKTPLLVRLARVLGEEEASAGITPGRLLRAHADRTVLADPIRAHLALRIVDKILKSEQKSISLKELLYDDSLRSLLLTTGEGSPLQQLVHEHILLLDRAPSSKGLPLPSKAMISFAFDAQLDYLAFAHMAQLFGTDPSVWCERLKDRASFGPLIGGLRVFFVESLLDNPSTQTITKLGNMIVSLGETGEEVLTEVLCVGLDCTSSSAIEQILCIFLQEGSVQSLADLTDDAIRRLVIAGRVDAVQDIMTMIRRIAPTEEFVQLCCYVIDIISWTISLPKAKSLAEDLFRDAENMSVGAQIQAGNAIGNLCYLSGLQSDISRAMDIEERILKLYAENRPVEQACHVIIALIHARKANKRKDGVAREGFLHDAHHAAQGNASLLMTVALNKALLYTDEGLNITDRAQRQKACHDAVQFACSIGDPFAEALACDIAAAGWYMDLGVQEDWIDRGLVAASALNAKVAQARLLDRRGRIHMAHGHLEDALQDAQEASLIFEAVGHQRHTLRTKQHLCALQIHEMDAPGVPYLAWDSLIALSDHLEVHFQSRLLRLLKASAYCDLGAWEKAQMLLDDVQERIQQKPLSKDVHMSMFQGELLWGQGAFKDALEHWKRAYAWSTEKEIPDLMFQSLLYMSWAKLMFSYRESVHDEHTVIEQIRSQLEQKKSSDHQQRYFGECTLVLCLAFVQKDLLQQANVKLQEAKDWFGQHPQHPLHGELKIVILIYKWYAEKSYQASQGIDVAKSPKKFLSKNGNKFQDIRDYIARLAQSYPDKAMQEAFVRHHRVTMMMEWYFSKELQ